MKRRTILNASVILAVNLLLSLVATAQVLTPEQVPDTVKLGFQAKFPTVKLAEWKIKSDQNYEAEFTLKGTDENSPALQRRDRSAQSARPVRDG